MNLIPRKKLRVIRKSMGRYVSGEWITGQSRNFNIEASVQGCNTKVLQSLPEGYRTSENYRLYTDTELKIAKDSVIINDQEFLVVKVTPWQHFVDTAHYEVVVVKDIHHEN